MRYGGRVYWLGEINFRKVGDGKTGPVTHAIRGKIAKYEQWCDYVEE